jgi:hypothetical protein
LLKSELPFGSRCGFGSAQHGWAEPAQADSGGQLTIEISIIWNATHFRPALMESGETDESFVFRLLLDCKPLQTGFGEWNAGLPVTACGHEIRSRRFKHINFSLKLDKNRPSLDPIKDLTNSNGISKFFGKPECS